MKAAIAEDDRSGWWARRPSVGEDGERPRCVRASSVAGNADMAGSNRSGSRARRSSAGEDGRCPRCVRASAVAAKCRLGRDLLERALEPKAVCWAGLAMVRGVSGLHRLPEVRPLPKVTGAGREPEVVYWRDWWWHEVGSGCGPELPESDWSEVFVRRRPVSSAVCARLGEDAKAQGLSDLPDCAKPGFGWVALPSHSSSAVCGPGM